jgi:DNA-binding TFAR19-related protein (PDSD5 family)
VGFSWLAVARIALVKPDKAKGVEDVILRGAQYGQITEKVSEDYYSPLNVMLFCLIDASTHVYNVRYRRH